MEFANQNAEAVSITFSYGNIFFGQSGFLINDRVITVAGQLIMNTLKMNVGSIHNFRITIHIQGEGRIDSFFGYILATIHSNEIRETISSNQAAYDLLHLDALPEFLFLGLRPPNKTIRDFDLLPQRKMLFRGQNILTISTPFGSHIFFNCYNNGIISNIVNDHLFFIDARLSPCCEGGPVFRSGELIGMVLSLIMASGEYMGLNICCSFYAITEAYLRQKRICLYYMPPLYVFHNDNGHYIDLRQSASDSVLLVSTPTSMGSSVVLTRNGLVVTCAHVIDFDLNTPVEVHIQGRRYPAFVLGTSSQNDILDLAFLQIYNLDVQIEPCKFSDTPVQKGDSVQVVGFEKIYNSFLPFITKGTVLNNEEGAPFYTSCLTHKGNSGGGVFRMDGRLAGIVCAIVLLSQYQGKLYNYLNLCIPIEYIKNGINFYVLTGNPYHLRRLCNMNTLSRGKWMLLLKCRSKL